MQFSLPQPSNLQKYVLNLYDTSYSRFCRLKEHYEEHRISQRVHGNCKSTPHNILPQAVTEEVKFFLTYYTKENAVLLLDKSPDYKMMTFPVYVYKSIHHTNGPKNSFPRVLCTSGGETIMV